MPEKSRSITFKEEPDGTDGKLPIAELNMVQTVKRIREKVGGLDRDYMAKGKDSSSSSERIRS